MFPYTDTHCHLDFDRFDKDREEVLSRAWEAGLTWILNPGIDIPTNQSAISLAKDYPGKINAAVGIHPNIGEPWTKETLTTLGEQALQPGVVAIGEIGLDYYRQHTPFEQQRIMLIDQLKLAEELNLPVIIHNRDSTQDLMLILGEWHAKLLQSGHPLAEHPGVLHSYSADEDTAQIAIGMNFFIGISGPVTFNNAQDLKSITRDLPLEFLLLETDAPFLTPHPHRGKRNEPAFIPLIAEEIARLHQVDTEYIAEITYANAQRLFQFSKT